jgi:hypothetical protein
MNALLFLAIMALLVTMLSTNLLAPVLLDILAPCVKPTLMNAHPVLAEMVVFVLIA